MIINKNDVNEILSLQKELDELVKKNNGIKEEDLTQHKYIALKTELHELINEIEEFKYWKKNKGKGHILEEGIDCIHFILSLMNDFEIIFEEDFEITEEQEKYMANKTISEIYVMIDVLINDSYMMKEWKETLYAIMLGIVIILQKCNYSEKDIVNEYKRKNQINVQRQKTNY